MASDIPTTKTLKEKFHIIYCATFHPAKFEILEESDNELLMENDRKGQKDASTPIEKLRESLISSFIWTISSVFAGTFIGLIAPLVFGASIKSSMTLAMLGTVIVLWATLALLNWRIQTFAGVTLTERVNVWIFRVSYALGTTLILAGTMWSLA